MLLIAKPRVHDGTQDLDMVLRKDSFALDDERFRVYPACVSGEMYDHRLFRLKSRTAPSLLVKCFVNYCLHSSPVALGRRSRHPRGVVVDEGDGPAIPINLSLH
jgi:hypothetical protein